MLIRKEWIDACGFHDLSETEVLREVSRRVSDLKAIAGGSKKAHPLVLLDLDSTLYEVGPRTHQILKEWVDSTESRSFKAVRDALGSLLPHHVGYSVRDTLTAMGLDPSKPEYAPAQESLKKFWAHRFFTSEY